MKKIPVLLLLLITGAMCSSRASTSFVSLAAGDLTDRNGLALPADSLLLLIVSGTNPTFEDSLHFGQFVEGDDVIVGSSSVNNNLGSIDATSNTFTLESVAAGQAVAIRWFSDFTLQQYLNGEKPGIGSYYETFAGRTTGTPNGGMAWSTLGATSTLTINFVTDSANTNLSLGLSDAYANIFGMALSQISAVPEPGTYPMLVSGLLLVILLRRWRRREKAT